MDDNNVVTENNEATENTINYEEELKKRDEEIKHLKALNSKANSEAAENKRKWQATMSEQEKKDAEIAEQNKARDEELQMYRNKERISSYKAKLMEVGYDAQTADDMAQTLPEGISDDFFAKQKSFIDDKVSAIKQEKFNSNPPLEGGEPPKVVDFDAMSDDEYYKSLKK